MYVLYNMMTQTNCNFIFQKQWKISFDLLKNLINHDKWTNYNKRKPKKSQENPLLSLCGWCLFIQHNLSASVQSALYNLNKVLIGWLDSALVYYILPSFK